MSMTEQDANKERLELALEAAGLDLWENDLITGDVVRKADKIFAELGYGKEGAITHIDDIFEIVHPDDIPLVQTAINDHLMGVTAQYRCEFRVRSRSGTWVWLANYGKITDRHDNNRGRRFIGVTFNIDDRKRQEELLTMREQEWRALVENSPDTIARYDTECRRIYVNPALCATLGGDMAAIIGKKPSECPGGQEYDAYESKIREVFATGKDVEFELTVKAEEEICNLIRLTAERDLSGSIKTVMGVGRNISELNAQRQHTSRMAFYDQLTSLPNRRLLIDRLQHALTSSAHSGLHGALIFIDLDNFKTLNDTLGHGIGDLLLKQVAQRLISCVRQEDTVARVGGDEFVIVLENLGNQIQQAAFQLETLAEKILATLNQPYHLADYDRQSTPSIGIVMFSGDKISIDDLMKRADIAMYQAKRVGRNSIRFFDLDMQAAVEMRSSLEESMKRALPQQQFMLLYQAQTDDTGKIVGAEVLLRWQHPTNGLILPDDFIHIAEETGLIVPIGLWVLKSACHQLKTWEQEPGKNHLHIAVNVSARQFQQADFVEQIIGMLKSTDINPSRLTLELTESMVLDSTPETISKMQALKKTGLKFAMDDFGTGHSSLSSLKKLPLDQLKIDQMFIRDITENNDAAIIVQTIIAMAHNLCMEVIAEGVETKMQKDFLIRHHCVNFQGYFFGKPMPIKEFEQALSQNLSYRRPENVLDNGSHLV